MLSWSNAKYKLTLGVGSLGLTAILAEMWQGILPAWAAATIALLPLVVFVFVHPGEMPTSIVRVAHVAASLWYLIVAFGLLIGLAWTRPSPGGWLLYPVFVSVGAIPCAVVLSREFRGRYEPGDDSEGVASEKEKESE
jgi:hypothetical protein